MGQIRIDINGSFADTTPRSTGSHTFPAIDLGHAAALSAAIAHLTGLLPAAIDLDHRLQATGAEPRKGFGLERTGPVE